MQNGDDGIYTLLLFLFMFLITVSFALGHGIGTRDANAACESRVETAVKCGGCGDKVAECGDLVCVPGQGWLKRGGE